MATGLGFPAISTPGALDLRAIQTAVSNARQRIEQLERLMATLTSAATSGSASTTTSAQINTLRNQLYALSVRVTALENATIDLGALIDALPYQSGASADMVVPVTYLGVAVKVLAGDIAALAGLAVDLGALIDALPFQSGTDPSMMVPVTLSGIAVRILLGDITAAAAAAVNLVALIDALPFQSGADAGMMVPVTIGGFGFRVTAGSIAALGGAGGGSGAWFFQSTDPVLTDPALIVPGVRWMDSDTSIEYTRVDDGVTDSWVEL